MTDKTLANWLAAEQERLLTFNSSILTVTPLGGNPCRRYLAELRCRTYAKDPSGAVVPVDGVALGINIPENYLRTTNGSMVVCLLAPNIWHPNVAPPLLCLGRIHPGESIVSILTRAYEVVTFQRVTSVESDSLNPAACAWIRNHLDLLPSDTGPLRRRELNLEVCAV
jgi:hypothetical protein